MGNLAFHRSIRIWSTIFCSGITGLSAISGCSRILGFSHVHPTYSCPLLIAILGRLPLGPASPFVCRLRVRLVCGLALLSLTIPRPSRPLDWFGIWSMKKFYNHNCWIWDVFEEFLHWPDASNLNYSLEHPTQTWIVSLLGSGQLFVKIDHFNGSRPLHLDGYGVHSI